MQHVEAEQVLITTASYCSIPKYRHYSTLQFQYAQQTRSNLLSHKLAARVRLVHCIATATCSTILKLMWVILETSGLRRKSRTARAKRAQKQRPTYAGLGDFDHFKPFEWSPCPVPTSWASIICSSKRLR